MSSGNLTNEWTFASVGQTLAALERGEVNSETLVSQQLARIAALDPKLRAYLDVYGDEALQTARWLDQRRAAGHSVGPLHGVTVAIKDLFEIEGHSITAGSKSLPARRSVVTATVVERLRQAGAIVLGKTHTVEFAFGGWGTNASMGTPWNPWDLAVHRVPGGSSSGSAVAVAAGLAHAAVGTDTGGSVRIPAGLCGLVGLKTTHGLVSRFGLLELCPTHDTVGPISRTVQDGALLLDAMAGPDRRDPASRTAPWRPVADHLVRDVKGLRVWVLPQAERSGVDAQVLAAYDQALMVLVTLGMELVEQPLPQSLEASMALAGNLMSAEGYQQLGALFERNELQFDPHIQRRILLGRTIGPARYAELLQQRQRAIVHMQKAMAAVDLCVFPTNAISAIAVADVDELATPLSRLGRFVNLLDLCSVAVPAGLSAQGLPISIQMVGRPFDELGILQVAHAFEQVSGWRQAVPPGLL